MPEYCWINDNIFIVSEFFTPDECDAWRAFAENEGFDEAPITTASGPVMRKDIRNNARVMVDDRSRADLLWTRAKPFVPERIRDWSAVGVNERLRFYRYNIGERFDWHYDGYFERENGERSHLTFMIYLNDGFDGGATSFDDTVIHPQKGMALFFIHHVLHRGDAVARGTKYVLRTDVMYQQDS